MGINPRINEVLAETLKIELARRDPWIFITEYCLTDKYQENKGMVEVVPIKMPNYPYLKRIIRHICRNKKIAIPKSRRLLVTWVVLCYCLWYALNHNNASIYIQKIKEDDAGFADPNESLCAKIMKVYERLPKALKQSVDPGITKKPPVISFKDTFSTIVGVAEGPDQVRGKGASIIVIDEMSMLDPTKNRAMLKTILPIVDAGAKLICISTPRGQEVFYEVCHGLEVEKR